MLASDLDGEEEKDRVCLENMLNTIITELNMRKPGNKYATIYQRSNEKEVHLVIMRLLSMHTPPSLRSNISILMSKYVPILKTLLPITQVY